MLVSSDFQPVESSDHPLDGFSGLALAVFLVVSGFCIQGVKIPLPFWFSARAARWAAKLRIIQSQTQSRLERERWHFPLDLKTAPPIGLLVLLASTASDGETIKKGIVGDGSMQPYDVLVLFISLVRRNTSIKTFHEYLLIFKSGLHSYRFGRHRRSRGSGLMGLEESWHLRSKALSRSLRLLLFSRVHSRQRPLDPQRHSFPVIPR